MKVNEKLKKLRDLMEKRNIDAYIEPTADPHQSEYVADYYKGRAFISGFTGSAGTVVVTKDKALLWTDGRYFIQAERQLGDSEFQLMKMNTPGFPTYMEWLSHTLKAGNTIGYNGKIMDDMSIERIKELFGGLRIDFEEKYDLVGEIWEDRPSLPKGDTFALEDKYTGKSAKDKIQEVRIHMEKSGADYFLLSSLDDIAWLYNIRGKDVANNPVVISYALISKDKAYLFVNKEKINNEVRTFLDENGVEICKYDEVVNYVEKIEKDSKILLEKSKTNRWLTASIPEGVKIIDEMNITTKLKGIKNRVEIENQRLAYIKDGVALVKFFHWIYKNLGRIQISEISAEDKLFEFRQEDGDFLENSFNTISAYGDNAAMMHYSATPESNRVFEEKGLYLVDSGGQYYEGTTDITRTLALGPITDEEIRDFTLTLKGHINLISARFLEGTSGHVLDVLSRYPLWQEGIDYKCGTGHGVGYLLNVHEGPHRFAVAPNTVALEKGMIITIEPGVYKAGRHGIRIENVVVVDKDIETDLGQFMKFETLSFAPIDLDAIDVDLLSEKEKAWLNNYHQETYNKLSPYLSDEEKAWLKHKTRSI
ncbi:aminopeptidase P family protein [Tissierella creatinini]|nr:aminopeptidase P family protein [Tissierella creatinini]TJX67389.1 aminopeptidase P family protein [Soehngenia saccharolytica]